LIEAGRLFAPREVLRELEKKDDEILAWAKNFPLIFIEPDAQQLQLVKDILAKHAGLIDPNKYIPDADPFVIALALSRRQGLFPSDCQVVTEEKLAGPGGLKIPNVCAAYNVPCIRLVNVFELEGWVF